MSRCFDFGLWRGRERLLFLFSVLCTWNTFKEPRFQNPPFQDLVPSFLQGKPSNAKLYNRYQKPIQTFHTNSCQKAIPYEKSKISQPLCEQIFTTKIQSLWKIFVPLFFSPVLKRLEPSSPVEAFVTNDIALAVKNKFQDHWRSMWANQLERESMVQGDRKSSQAVDREVWQHMLDFWETTYCLTRTCTSPIAAPILEGEPAPLYYLPE